jgi:predicted nucleotidyltransferase
MGVTGDVLVALAGLRAPTSGRRVAERAGASPAHVATVLGALVDSGLAIATPAAPAILYELNRDHVLAPVVEGVVAARFEWRLRVAAAIERWVVPPVAVVLFGSAATGTGSAESDIDLLVVRPPSIELGDDVWAGQIDQLGGSVRRWTGNAVDILDLSSDELRDRRRLAGEIERDGVVLAGELSSMAPGR